MSVYLDCNATTPIERRVKDVVLHYLELEFGNASSRTHIWGTKAKQAVEKARQQVAAVIKAEPNEIIFTSGATESNNIAILGIASHANQINKKHIITTAIEHKSVLEPVNVLRKRGFDVTVVPSDCNGRVDVRSIEKNLRADTVLISVMHANNETGVIQPLQDIADLLNNHDAFFHVDAAQGFGKDLPSLTSKRIDLISISGHKIFAPKGVGCLVVRRRGYKRVPLEPLFWGGGQEGGLRPGTLPVHLIAGLGEASELASKEHQLRQEMCLRYRQKILDAISPLNPRINGDQANTLSHVLNISITGVNSEAAIVALKDIAGFSNGSACTSQSYEPSHVLTAMEIPEKDMYSAIRLSWSHLTEEPNWDDFTQQLKNLVR